MKVWLMVGPAEYRGKAGFGGDHCSDLMCLTNHHIVPFSDTVCKVKPLPNDVSKR